MIDKLLNKNNPSTTINIIKPLEFDSLFILSILYYLNYTINIFLFQ